MQDYYKILEIEQHVEQLEIKKAYFKMVRKYPPDRYPKEFMAIRSAYEVLIDPHTRQQYDICDNMPPLAKLNFDEGKLQLEKGNAHRAIPYLEAAKELYSDFTIIDALLGDAYLANQNSGKAIKIFEKLVEDEPDNAGFSGKLAHAYLGRGWHKKANLQYEKALSLDEDNISLWIGYIESFMDSRELSKAKKVALEGIKVSQKNNWDSLELYYHIIQIDIISKDLKSIKDHLNQMKTLAKRNEEEKGNVAWFMVMVGKFFHSYEYVEESTQFINAAYELLPEDIEIQNIKKEIEKSASVLINLQKLEDDNLVNDLMIALLDFELNRCHDETCFECPHRGLSLELEMIMERDACVKDIRFLKKSYPEFFNLKKDFFETLLLFENPDKIFYRYRKKMDQLLKKMPMSNTPFDEFDAFEDEISEQPYVREKVKVGRNDPCPCGSGKKYKKCCMK